MLVGGACGTVALAADAYAPVDSEIAFHHREPLDLVWVGDGFVVVTSCVGCLVDVRVEDWTKADSRSGRRLRDGVSLAAEPGFPADEAFFSVAEVNVPIAIDVTATVEEETGVFVDQRATAFGRIDEQGDFESTNWRTWVCEARMALCELGADGNVEITLSVSQDQGSP